MVKTQFIHIINDTISRFSQCIISLQKSTYLSTLINPREFSLIDFLKTTFYNGTQYLQQPPYKNYCINFSRAFSHLISIQDNILKKNALSMFYKDSNDVILELGLTSLASNHTGFIF